MSLKYFYIITKHSLESLTYVSTSLKINTTFPINPMASCTILALIAEKCVR